MNNENNTALVKSKKNKVGVILLVIILLIIVAAGGFMLGIKYAHKDDLVAKDKNETADNNNAVTVDITKEDIEDFLSPLVSGEPSYNLLLLADKNSDEEIFGKAIQYLLANNKYTKSNNNYIFNQSDIKEVTDKYLMKENFDYIATSSNFTYNSSSKTFSSMLEFGVFGFSAVVTKEVENYSVNGNEITVIYKVSTAHLSLETGDIDSEYNSLYTITLEKLNNGLKIKNVINN